MHVRAHAHSQPQTCTYAKLLHVRASYVVSLRLRRDSEIYQCSINLLLGARIVDLKRAVVRWHRNYGHCSRSALNSAALLLLREAFGRAEGRMFWATAVAASRIAAMRRLYTRHNLPSFATTNSEQPHIRNVCKKAFATRDAIYL